MKKILAYIAPSLSETIMKLAMAAMALLAAAGGALAQDSAASSFPGSGYSPASSVDNKFHADVSSALLSEGDHGDLIGAEGEDGQTLDPLSIRRELQLQSGQIGVDHKYRELPCNGPLPDLPAKPTVDNLTDAGCLKLSSVTATGANGEKVIPCGSCVYVDTEGTIDLPGGLDIHGMLVFPHNHKNTIVNTPSVYLQGVLQITNDEEIKPENEGVKFFLTGSSDRTFTPHEQHFDTNNVNANSKPFIVAGGRLNIDAFKDGCPTWLNIQDVVYDEYESGLDPGSYLAPEEPNSGCHRELIATDFENGQDMWKGMLGGVDTVQLDEVDMEGNVVSSNSYLRIANRTRNWQGPTIDLSAKQRDCLRPNTHFTFAAKFRIYREDGQSTNCASMGTNCLMLTTFHRENPSNSDRWYEKSKLQATQGVGRQTHSDLVKDEQWFTWMGKFQFSDIEGDPERSVAERIRFSGPEEGVVIEMDDLRIGLPESDSYSDATDISNGDICQDLFPVDKGADGYFDPPRFPYPLRTNHGYWSQILVMQEEDESAPGGVNNFYRLAHRWEEWNSLSFDLTGGCLRIGAAYRVSFRARINHPGVFKHSKVEIRVIPNFEGHWTDWGAAPETPAGAGAGWVHYTKDIIVTDKMAAAAADGRVEFRLNTAWPEGSWGQNSYADIDYDDIEIKLVHGPIKGLVVDNSAVVGCWGAGSEIVVAPHTSDWGKRQVVTLDSENPVSNTDGKTVLNLETALTYHPTTVVQDPMQATEVGLLQRNTKFEGDTDVNNRGGYLNVMNTFNVTQKIRGVEIRNFGYQRVGNRYPIGFARLHEIPGSRIEANTIRGSQFRCIIMEGTSGVLIKDNVAFDNRGICYGTLRGKEIVTFEKNLAVRTKDHHSDGHITSAFFIRDPRAVLKGNVAAGCERRGFYYGLLHYIEGSYRSIPPSGNWNPRDKHLGAFEDNIAHSMQDWGLVVHDYHPRWNEPVNTQTFRNYRGYKSTNNAYFKARDVAMEGFYLADARDRNVDLEFCDNCSIKDVTIVGWSQDYRKKVADQNVWHTCKNEPHRLDRLMGLEVLHMPWWRDWWYRDSTPPGVTMENVRFEGFQDTGCDRTNPLYVQRHRLTPHFDNFIQIKNMTADSNASAPCLCTFEDLEVQDVAIADLDSSMHPDGQNAFDGVSSIVSDYPYMKAFAGGDCKSNADKCFAYCENTCLRTVTFDVSPYETEDVMMVVTDIDSNKTASFPGNFELSKTTVNGMLVPDVYHNTFHYDVRKFSLVLPAGKYSAKFVDKDGNDFWPTFAYISRWERDPSCGGVQKGHITLEEPAPTVEYCSELVRNGDINGNYTHWVHTNGGVYVVNETDQEGGSFALLSKRSHKDHGIGFHVDTRCMGLMEGQEYVINALIRTQDKDGNPVACNPDTYDEWSGCPSMFAQAKWWDESANNFQHENFYWLAMSVRPKTDDGGYTLIEGTFVVNDRMAKADSVLFWITRGGSSHISVDSASIRTLDRANPVPSVAVEGAQQTPTILSASMDPPECPDQFLVNGDFEMTNTTQYWRIRSYSGKLSIVQPGVGGSGNAIKVTNRDNPYQGPIQWINPECWEEGKEYEFSARFRLTDPSTGQVTVCNPLQGHSHASDVCPIITIQTNLGVVHLAKTVDPGDDTDKWGTIHAIVTPHYAMLNSWHAYLYVEYVPAGVDLTVDDFSAKPYVKDCTNAVMNGDFEVGTTQGVWKQEHGGDALAVVNGEGYGDSIHALRLNNRPSRDSLIYQDLDKDCLEAGANYLIEAKVKMYKDGSVFTCNKNVIGGAEECPIADIRTDAPEARGRVVGAVCADDNDGWYYVRGTFEIYPFDMEGNRLQLRFFRAPVGVDLEVDDVKLTRKDG